MKKIVWINKITNVDPKDFLEIFKNSKLEFSRSYIFLVFTRYRHRLGGSPIYL